MAKPKTAPGKTAHKPLALHAPDSVEASNGTLTVGLDVAPLQPADFEPSTLLDIYRTMLTSRRLDEKMITLLKQGKGFFHIGCAGHEAAQAAVALYSRPGHDWFTMYYRDMCMALSLGMTARQILLAHLAKAVTRLCWVHIVQQREVIQQIVILEYPRRTQHRAGSGFHGYNDCRHRPLCCGLCARRWLVKSSAR